MRQDLVGLSFALILIGAILWAVGVPYAGLLILVGIIVLAFAIIRRAGI